MLQQVEDTIIAIASAPAGSLRGILRMSGPNAVAVVSQVVVDDAARRCVEHLAVSGVVEADLRLDDGVALPSELFIWPTERSYTRQPVVEVHTLGSPPLLDAALRVLCQAGARLAAPGEFTLRAFLSGRLDLAQAEAVLGVIDAQDRRALDVALSQLAGGLSRPLGDLRDALVDMLADLEAGLDFVDEDIEFVSNAEVVSRLDDAGRAIDELFEQLGRRSQRADAFRVVLAGAPNAGKSSLFNALVGGSAIVSDVAGTTRDALVACVEFGGMVCELVDTAGLSERHPQATPSTIDEFAQTQTRDRIAAADLELWCFDAAAPSDAMPANMRGNRLYVATKADQQSVAGSRIPNPEFPAFRVPIPAPLSTSSVTGQGLAELRSAIAAAAHDAMHGESSVVASTAARCEESLRVAGAAIEEARGLAAARAGDELIAAELRLALVELGKIVGVVYTDDILDRLFRRFCIGK